MFTYPITTSAPSYVSAFDDAVAALSPDAYYSFQDASYATQINDLSGNDYHLISQLTNPANTVSPIRSSVAKACQTIGATGGATWPDNASHYETATTDISVNHISSQTKICVQFSIRTTSTVSVADMRCFFSGYNEASTYGIGCYLVNGNNYMRIQIKNTASQYATTTVVANDGVGHILTLASDDVANTLKGYFDGVEIISSTTYTMNAGLTFPLTMGGHLNLNYATQSFETDHFSLWGGTIPSAAQIIDMQDKYLAELP